MKFELTLCPKCLHNFASRPNTKVRRADYTNKHKEPCCFCQVSFGYDYVIEEKSSIHNVKSHIC